MKLTINGKEISWEDFSLIYPSDFIRNEIDMEILRQIREEQNKNKNDK